MSVEHLCKDRPSFRKGSNPWVKGRVEDCPHHGMRKPSAQPRVVKGHDE